MTLHLGTAAVCDAAAILIHENGLCTAQQSLRLIDMADPDPNVEFIYAYVAAETAHSIHAALASHGMSELIKLLHAFNGITNQMERACVIDFCWRHRSDGFFDNAFHFIGIARTNCCSTCHRPGHNKNHCPF